LKGKGLVRNLYFTMTLGLFVKVHLHSVLISFRH
jgi:hypothetical protein